MSEELVRSIFRDLFGTCPDAHALFEQFMKSTEGQSARVRLAVLKLSEGNPQKLLQFSEAAQTDYRDVLAWAEYPEQLRSGARRDNTPPEVYAAILAADRRQYEAWLAEHKRSTSLDDLKHPALCADD